MENGSESGWRRTLSLVLILGGFGGYAFAISRSIDVLDRFNFGEDFQKRFAIYYILVLSMLTVIFLVVRFYMADRKEKFANITPRLHNVVSCCKDLHSDLLARTFAGTAPTKAESDQLVKDSQRRLREICDGAAHVFGMLTSTHCRASIKVITSDADRRPYIFTLARDNSSHQLHPFLDRNRYEQKIDPLDENSQFRILADDTNPTYQFFSNNLLREKGFKTTSIAAYKLQNNRRRTR